MFTTDSDTDCLARFSIICTSTGKYESPACACSRRVSECCSRAATTADTARRPQDKARFAARPPAAQLAQPLWLTRPACGRGHLTLRTDELIKSPSAAVAAQTTPPPHRRRLRNKVLLFSISKIVHLSKKIAVSVHVTPPVPPKLTHSPSHQPPAEFASTPPEPSPDKKSQVS